MEKHKRYNGLDALRTYMMLGIVLMHVLENGGGYQKSGFILESLIPSFTNFVFLFMMVSAFGMCCGYYEKIRNSSISIDEFYSKRYEKMWPFFALLCLLDIVISPSINAIYEVFANLTLCFGLLPNANITVIGVGWTLGVIFVFYLLFPFFCYLIGNKKKAWMTLVVALLFNLIASKYFDADRTNIVYSAVYFVAGGMIYLYRELLKKVAEQKKVLVWTVVAVSTVLYFLIGANVFTMLFVSVGLLVASLGNNRGGERIAQFVCSVYQRYQLRDLSLPHGNLPCY